MSAAPLSNPRQIAERGEAIYRDRYQQQYERDYPGKFVAIDVQTENAYIADTPEDALADAHTQAPQGIFHLIQVGHAGAFRVSYAKSSHVDWVFR